MIAGKLRLERQIRREDKRRRTSLPQQVPGTLDTLSLQHIEFRFRPGQSCRVLEDDVNSVQAHTFRNGIPRRPRNVGHDHPLFAEESIEKTRLPGVWKTGKHDLRPFPEQPSPLI